jgi:hypothetical protein
MEVENLYGRFEGHSLKQHSSQMCDATAEFRICSHRFSKVDFFRFERLIAFRLSTS